MNNQNTSNCRLCLQKGKLCNSHIFPEFFYKEIYNEKHQMLQISVNPQDKVRWIQKGVREYLLCETCETQLSRYERYAENLFLGGNSYAAPQVLQNDRYFIVSEKINYKLLKLFQMSLLWRGGISSLKEFGAVDLGPHEENLRRMIHQEDPGKPNEYGCVLFFLSNQGKLFDAVSSPEKLKIEGHTCYRYMLGGFIWVHFVSSHSPPHDYIKCFLQDNGQFAIAKADPRDLPFLKRQARQFTKRQADVKRLVNRAKT